MKKSVLYLNTEILPHINSSPAYKTSRLNQSTSKSVLFNEELELVSELNFDEPILKTERIPTTKFRNV